MSELLQIVISLMSPNNTVRSEAENLYQQKLELDLLSAVQEVMVILSDSTVDINARLLCGILLRRQVDKIVEISGNNWTIFEQFRANVLSMWLNEMNPSILKKLSHILSQSTTHKNWPELIPTVLNHAKQCNINGLLSIIQFIEILTEYSPDDVVTNISSIGTFLSQCNAINDTVVQVACAKAICACIVYLEDENSRNTFKLALPSIINVLGATLSRGDEIDATSLMEYLISIIQSYPTFIKGNVDGIVNAMLSVASSMSLEFSTRSTALELMVTFTESAPALARKCPELINGLIPLAMSIMLDVESDESTWIKEKYICDISSGNNESSGDMSNDQDNSILGEEAIERVATGLGGKLITPLVLNIVQQYASSPDPRYRRAAVAGLVRLAEGSSSTFKKSLKDAINFLSHLANDTSVRVQYEVIQV